MTNITSAFPEIVTPGGGYLFVDNSTLMNFAAVGKLSLVLTSNRTVVLTPEVQAEADKARFSDNEQVRSQAESVKQ